MFWYIHLSHRFCMDEPASLTHSAIGHLKTMYPEHRSLIARISRQYDPRRRVSSEGLLACLHSPFERHPLSCRLVNIHYHQLLVFSSISISISISLLLILIHTSATTQSQSVNRSIRISNTEKGDSMRRTACQSLYLTPHTPQAPADAPTEFYLVKEGYLHPLSAFVTSCPPGLYTHPPAPRFLGRIPSSD